MLSRRIEWVPWSRVEESKRRLEAVWWLEEADRIPYIIETPRVDLGYGFLEAFKDPFKKLKQQLADVKHHFEVCVDDLVPFVWPYYGIGVVASSFGCPVVWMEGQDPWVKPVIHKPEQVYELKQPNPFEDGLGPLVIESIKQWQRILDPRMPMLMTDIQGPLSTAYMLFDHYNFFKYMYESPKEIHHLLRLTAKATIDFVKAQLEVMENPYPPGHLWIWRPQNILGYSNDLLALLSPKLYEEFGLPYDSQLSELFGGVCFWSDGRIVHNIKSVMKIPNFFGIGFNTNVQDPLEICRRIDGRACSFITIANKYINYPENYIETLLPSICSYPTIIHYKLPYEASKTKTLHKLTKITPLTKRQRQGGKRKP